MESLALGCIKIYVQLYKALIGFQVLCQIGGSFIRFHIRHGPSLLVGLATLIVRVKVVDIILKCSHHHYEQVPIALQ